MTIIVTQKHIDEGCKEHSSECPIALAILDNYPGRRIRVLPSKIEIFDKDSRLCIASFTTPYKVVLFIVGFDCPELNSPVKPFSFELAERKI